MKSVMVAVVIVCAITTSAHGAGIKNALQCRSLEVQYAWAMAKVNAGLKPTALQMALYHRKRAWYDANCHA